MGSTISGTGAFGGLIGLVLCIGFGVAEKPSGLYVIGSPITPPL